MAACTDHQQHFISLFSRWYALVVYYSQCLKTQSSSRCKSSSPPALQVCWHHIHLCLFTTQECIVLCMFILQWWLTVFNIFGIKICYNFPFKGISSGVQFVTLKIYLWYPSFGCLQFFPKIPIKLTLKMGGRVVIGTHPDQSNYLANQQQVWGFVVPFTNLSKLYKNAGRRPFATPNRHVLTFLIYFNLQGIILSISGVALTTFPQKISRKVRSIQ